MIGGVFEIETENKNENEYMYSDRDIYLLNHYIDRVTFSKCQVQRQLDYALKRKKDQIFELKVFIGVFFFYLLNRYFFYVMTMSANAIVFIIGQFVFAALEIGGLVLIPLCVYRIVRGSFILAMDKFGDYREMRTFQTEIQECQKYLEKYRLLLEDLNQWKKEVMQGRVISDEMVYEKMHGVELEPKIPIIMDNFGKMGKFYTICTIALTVLVFAVFVIVF